MKKIILLLLCTMLMLNGCTNVKKAKSENESMFIVIEETKFWKVVYHKDTKVMYVSSTGGYNHGNFTLLVNADGSPMIYDGEESK